MRAPRCTFAPLVAEGTTRMSPMSQKLTEFTKKKEPKKKQDDGCCCWFM